MRALFMLLAVTAMAQVQVRDTLPVPDIPGYKTLKCDFHLHTVFSDGDVWPTVRVTEAFRDGLDAIAITERTRAIIPVHLYGQPCEMEPILAIARKYNLRVIEDAAHAHGAYYYDSRAGSFGGVGCFSFYPTKTFGAYGDAGAIVTSDPEMDAHLRQLRYMGQKVKHHHEILGYQKRMDELQAAILRVKLPHLNAWITRRQAIAARYRELLSGTPLVLPHVAPNRTHAYYLYTVLAPRRDELRNYLTERGIGTQIIYPILVPDQSAYRQQLIRCGPIPVARSLEDQLVCLPMFPELRDDEVDRVAAAIQDFFAGSH